MADMTLDEYIDWFLSSNQDPILQTVVQNILDEPIPEAVKKRLLKPLLPLPPKPIPAPRKHKLEKRQTVLHELRPWPSSTPFRICKQELQLTAVRISSACDDWYIVMGNYCAIREIAVEYYSNASIVTPLTRLI